MPRSHGAKPAVWDTAHRPFERCGDERVPHMWCVRSSPCSNLVLGVGVMSQTRLCGGFAHWSTMLG